MVDAPKHELALVDYQAGMKYKEIAKKYGVSLNTVKSWRTRHQWVKEKGKKGCMQKGGQPGNKNAQGHGAPKQNKNAEKHGLFSKYLPDETLDIFEELRKKSFSDILFENILVQYAAIIRAQRIMYVRDQSDTTKELKRVKTTSSGKNKSSEVEYEIQFAWDKQASYLQAQSRAMQTLTNMIKQFREMTAPDDERLLRLELLNVELEKKRKDAEISGHDVVDDWISGMMNEPNGISEPEEGDSS